MSFLPQSKFKTNAAKEHKNIASYGFDIAASLRREGRLTHQPELTAAMLSKESFDPKIDSAAADMVNGVLTSIESFFRGVDNPDVAAKKFTPQQQEAVGFALISAQNPADHIRRVHAQKSYQTDAMTVFIPDHSGLRDGQLGQKSVEAYDTKPNDDTLNYTAAFALATATQNRFGELFYKTVNLSPEQYAVEMEIPIITVMPQYRHELEKKITDFQRLNIVNAEIDHTILKNDTLKIIPIVRAQTLDAFVDPNLVAPYSVTNEEGETFNTAPLAAGVMTSLYRLAMTDIQMQKGPADQTDALDPGAKLDAVYIAFTQGNTTEVVRFDTRNSPLNQFVENRQGTARKMDLQYVTDAAVISNDTKLVNGGTPTLFGAFQGDTGNTAWLSFSLRGDIDLETSNLELVPGSVRVNTIKNSQDVNLDIDAQGQAAMKALLNSAKVIGFDIDVKKVNSNLRELGQLANFNTYRQIYGVNLGSPISVQRPITNGDAQDALHAAALSYMCKTRQSNLAITTLQDEVVALRQYKKRTNIVGRQPEIMGISSFLIEPVLEELEIDLLQVVTTTSQHERRDDIQAILTDAVTITGYKLWQLSNWQAAANLLEGTEAQYPVIKVGTDLVLTQYLMVNGDTRTVGPDFQMQKASTPDKRVRDKIYIALGYPSSNPGVPHLLDHGMMLNKPEVVAALNLSRTSHSRELIVHPSFRHIPLCPILGVITVKNLQEALTKKATLEVSVANAADFPAGGSTDPDPTPAP